MEKPTFKLVGSPCGHHGQYTFYKAIRLTFGSKERIVAIGDFFFVRIWQDSELVSVGELQLLWTDRVSDQTLVSLRLYFLPENTPDGRNQHGQDEVLAINDKVVLKAEDLLSWVSDGAGWRWGLRAVWRGACAPPTEPRHTAPLHHTRLDFSDVEKEKSAIVDTESPGVVVFSYPQYCRYRALLSRLEGIQADWLRDSLVAALGGYAAPTTNTRILYCKDTFEYPELEGHEFVCNHLAPKLKGRPRGRRRRARPGSRSPSPSASPSPSPSDAETDRERDRERTLPTPRRLSLRNGGDIKSEDDDDDKREEKREEKREDTSEDKAFLVAVKQFYRNRNETLKTGYNTLKDLSLRGLYESVSSRGGYESVCRHKLWRVLFPERPARTRRHYERFLLSYENHERRNGTALKLNGKLSEPRTIATIEVGDSPPREDTGGRHIGDKRLRTPEPTEVVDSETSEVKEELNLISKPAEELNREFLESLPLERDRPARIAVKPVETLVALTVSEVPPPAREGAGNSLSSLSALGDKYVNGHDAAPAAQKNKPVGRSSLRAVRVKPGRPNHASAHTPPTSGVRVSPVSPSPAPLTNFGIHHPPAPAPPPPHLRAPPHPHHSDDEIVEVPYKPKTPEIIDLDEYPESPQSVKKKKLDILKERGLEVTAVPAWPLRPPLTPLLTPPMVMNPAVQHQIVTQAQLFQMYNILPQAYNGAQPPRVIQAPSIFGTSGPEKTVYGNPKDPFMAPPHVLRGAPVKQLRQPPAPAAPHDVLDLTCKGSPPPHRPTLDVVRVPAAPSPAHHLSKSYTLVDGKAVVGSNLEITLVNPRSQTPSKNRPPQKRSSNGKFVSSKTPTPPKEAPGQFSSPAAAKKNPIVVPSYQIRDDISPTSSTGSRDSQTNAQSSFLSQVLKSQGLGGLVDLGGGAGVTGGAGVGGVGGGYMAALYGHLDQRQLAAYRDMVRDHFRGYSGLLSMGAATGTPTTKN